MFGGIRPGRNGYGASDGDRFSSMCGRYSLQTPLEELAELFSARVRTDETGPRYNVAPTEAIPVLRALPDGREITRIRWGLVPAWSRDPAAVPLIINARAESLERKPAFRDLLAGRRCAVLADGFYEWRVEGGRKQPYYVRRRDGRPIAFAGLWDRHDATDSCAIVTTEANALLRPLHDRMPVTLDSPDSPWLDPERHDFAGLRELLRPCPAGVLEACPVSARVNRVSVDDAGCVEPLARPIREEAGWRDRPGPAPTSDQLGLF